MIAFDAGARSETAEENGIAHFLEHLVFKGGETYPTHRDVNRTAERLGAALNAYTSHDVVAFHITCRSEAALPALDLLTDFVARPHIDEAELDRERGVVIQEIARQHDQPAAVASELMDRAAFGDHPLGRSVLGTADHINAFTRRDVVEFRARRWSAPRRVAILAGDTEGIDVAEAQALLDRFAPRRAAAENDPAPARRRRIEVEPRDTEQSHLRLFYPLRLPRVDLAHRAATIVAVAVLGGPMGSRLFEEIREDRGLCYSISAAVHHYADASGVWISAGLQSDRLGEAYERIRAIVGDLRRNGPTEEESDRAMSFTVGSRIRRYERTSEVASFAARQAVVFPEDPLVPSALTDSMEAATHADARSVFCEWLSDGEPSVALVGPHAAGDVG